MATRRIAARRGVGWVTDGIGVFARRPGPYVQACLFIGLISSLPIVGLLFGLAMPFFYGGLLALLRRQASGGEPASAQAFDAFQQPGALPRLLPIVLVNIAVAVAFIVILVLAVGSALAPLIQSGQSIEAHPELVLSLLPKLALLFVFLLPIAIVFSWIMMLAIPHAMLDEVPGVQALGEAWAAVRGNLAPLIVNLLCLILVMSIMMLIMMVPLMAIAVLQQHSPILGAFLQVPVMAVFTAAILMIYCAIMYQAWLEIFGMEKPVPANDQVLV